MVLLLKNIVLLSHSQRSTPIFFIVSVLISSCARELEKAEYIRWVQDPKNGLHVIKATSGFVFDLQYQPSDYLWLQSGDQNQATLANQPDNIQHYLLSVSELDPELGLDNNEKQERLYYFSYLFQNDIHLEEDGNLEPCMLYHYEGQRSTGNKRIFLLGFENRNSKSNEAKVLIQSKYFGSLPIRIKNVKENIPTLKI